MTPSAKERRPSVAGYERSIRLQFIPRGDGLRREQTRLDRRQDSFSALGIGQTGCVPDEEHVVACDVPIRCAVEQISMTP